ncbi:MAG: hypothetical protein L0Y44_06010 [Phycisphaerales bacterium]|nr:hypothetical protein [Phycisphaerales bacterium]
MKRSFIAWTFCIAILNASHAAAQTTIEKIAPEKTVFIAGTKKAQTMIEHLKATGLWSLWQSEQLKSLRADAMKTMATDIEQMLEDLGVEKDTLVAPNGAVGVALFAATDHELGTTNIGFLAMADYGDPASADKTDQLIQAALKRGEEKDNIEFEEKDLAGRTLFSIDISKMTKDEGAADRDLDDGFQGDDEFGDAFPMPATKGPFDHIQTIHYLRDGNSVLLCSELTALTEALDVIDGRAAKGAGPAGFADRPDFQALQGKVGENDAYAIVLTRDLVDILSANDDAGMLEMMVPMVRSVVGKVDGYGLGVRLNGPSAMIEQSFAVYMPGGKAGLTTLIDRPLARTSLPQFASADTLSYSGVSFEFSGLMDVIRTVVNSNPMLQMQVGQELPDIEESLSPMTTALGMQVHVTSSATKPFTDASFKSLLAIDCPKPQQFEDALAALAGPLEARDFLGQRIYSIEPEMLGPMLPEMGMEMESLSIGIGGGFVLLGPTPAVEQGLRATSQAAAGGLAANADFQRAAAALPVRGAAAWGYTDTVNSIEATLAQQRMMLQKEIDQQRAWDPESAAAMEARLKEELALLDKIDFKLLREHIGPSIWRMRATEDGFEGNAYLLSAKDQ